MTVITPKLGQKRLDSCDLARPKWAGFHEKRGKCGCDAFKIDEIALDDTVRVENAHQNGQTRPNNTLLGKYRLIYCNYAVFVYFDAHVLLTASLNLMSF